MNITPEQIPDEVVEAALAAFNEFPCPKPGSITRCSNDDQMKSALAAALPVLLGEPVAWMLVRAKDGFIRATYNAEPTEEQFAIAACDGDEYRPLYTIPTPETPNAHL